MNSSFLDDFKNAWGKPNNALAQIIIINVIVFVGIAIIYVVTKISGTEFIYEFVHDQFSIPPLFSDFITRPWTILTYAFNHTLFDIFHILFNMLILNWFGQLIVQYLGNQKVISLYILGTFAGALVYLLVFNFVPFYIERSEFPGMVGASAAVYAVTVAAATLMPEFKFHLLFFGPVKIKYIAAFYIVLSFIGSVGGNAGGNIAHLGGAAIGYFYIRQLQAGNDIGNWVITTMNFFKSFFVSQSKIKVTHKSTGRSSSGSASASSTTSRATSSTFTTNQDEIDAILDKISKSGYESLSKSEKQKLFNASKK
jgi:membrane associated rhomboid family serine protease